MDQIGATLREAREAKGIGIRDVEEETKIRAKYLAALETGQYEQIPGAVYAKGFLRTYANFLGLDSGILVEQLRAILEPAAPEVKGRLAAADQRPEPAPQHVVPVPPRVSPTPPPTKSPPTPAPDRTPDRTPDSSRRWPAVVIAVVLLAGLAIGGWKLLAGNSRPSQSPQPQPAPTAGTSPTPTTPTPTPQPPAKPDVVITPGTIAEQTWPITVKGAGTLTVQVHLPHEAWLKVSADGVDKTDGGQIYKAGLDPTFTGKQSIVIGTGWPESLKLTVNGQDLPAITFTQPLTINVSLTK